MALSGSTIWEVETGGSDTANAGCFDPSQTAGMLTNGAATAANTSAPVFTSASYNFVAGDVGAWVFIAGGSNSIPGWYKIVSVAANAATLNATIGQAVLFSATYNTPTGLSTAVGCASVASPTVLTWTIDYSQQSSVAITYSDLISAGTGLTCSSAAHPFGKQQVGNGLRITGGTNFNVGTYVIASVSVGLVATVVGVTNITNGVGATGAGGLGGAHASLGQTFVSSVNNNTYFIQAGTYSFTTPSTNVSAGVISTSLGGAIEGYGTYRCDLGTHPVLQAGIGSITLFNNAGSVFWSIANVIVDGNAQSTVTGLAPGRSLLQYVTVKNCTTAAVTGGATTGAVFCVFTANGLGFTGGRAEFCESYSNTGSGFLTTGAAADGFNSCISYNNTGGGSLGFSLATNGNFATNCVAYGNGSDGFYCFVSNPCRFINCHSENNTGLGFNSNNVIENWLINCSAYNNTGGSGVAKFRSVTPLIVPTVSVFINAAGSNFALNGSPGGGALLRAAGFPTAFPASGSVNSRDIGAVQSRNLASRWDGTGGMNN